MAMLRFVQGRLREVIEIAEKGPPIKRFGALVPVWRSWLPLGYVELGREVEARAELEALAADDFASVRSFALLPAGSWLALACGFLGDTDRAATLYGLLRPYADYCVTIGATTIIHGPVSDYLGILAATMRKWDDAEGHFADALDRCARLRARPFDARFRYEYARMLLARGEPSDRARALELVGQALDAAEEIGMVGVAAKARRAASRGAGDRLRLTERPIPVNPGRRPVA
jgi:hypothetical protein